MPTVQSICLLLIFIATCFADSAFSQEADPKLLSVPEFVLSDEAVAAGIDGTMFVSLSIDKTGTVKDVQILTGPAWPCGKSPMDAIDRVKEAVKRNLLEAKFSPMMKGGKPKGAELTIDFIIGQAYKDAVKVEALKTAGLQPKLVDAGVVNGRAISLPKPINPSGAQPFPVSGTVTVKVTIGEDGNVVLAGVVRGVPLLHNSARRAACEAKFSPTTINGKPVRVAGQIVYDFVSPSRQARPPGF